MKKSALSVFLAELAGHSVALDNSVTEDDFQELLRLEQRIENHYTPRYAGTDIYKSMQSIVDELRRKYVSTLGFDKKEV